MNPDSQLDELTRLVDLMIDCADDRTRDRVLIEALESLGWAQAAALYRRAPGSVDAPGSGWFEVLARGPADLLPTAGEVDAIASGDLPSELPLGRQVFVSGRRGDSTALAVGGLGCDEEQLDLVQALFEVLVSVRGGTEEPAPSLLGLIEAPLPASGGDEHGGDEVHELRNLLTSINTVQSLLSGEMGELEDDDSQRYETIFDHECERAADLLGEALAGTQARDAQGACCPSAELSAWTRRERQRKADEGIAIEHLGAMALDERAVEMSAADFRRGLALVTDNALAALRAAGPGDSSRGTGRLQLLWTPQATNAALLVVEDDGVERDAEDLPELCAQLRQLGWRLELPRRTPSGLRVSASFELS